ncbi:TPA: hypothetical protein ACGO35_001818 [Streptococcus suis]
MTIQELQVAIHKLNQACKDAKQQLSHGEKGLNHLAQTIHHHTEGSGTGRQATEVTRSAAIKMKKAIENIQMLERELSDYLRTISQ